MPVTECEPLAPIEALPCGCVAGPDPAHRGAPILWVRLRLCVPHLAATGVDGLTTLQLDRLHADARLGMEWFRSRQRAALVAAPAATGPGRTP